MRQILQNLRTGATELAEVPAPAARAGEVLIRTTRSLISAGTERMLVEFGRASLLAKARSQPDKVRQVLEKIRTDGLLPTIDQLEATPTTLAPGARSTSPSSRRRLRA